MPSSLIQISKTEISTATSFTTITGIDDTYEVYLLKIEDMHSVTDNRDVHLSFTVSGVEDTSANYTNHCTEFRSPTGYGTRSQTGQTVIPIGGNLGNATNETLSGLLWLFNFSNASEASYVQFETTYSTNQPDGEGRHGRGLLAVDQATDGIVIGMASTNTFDRAKFTLYGLAK